MSNESEKRREVLLAGLGALMAQLGVDSAVAQDAAKVMPKTYRIAFENAQVRVLDFSGRPGMGICGEGVHSHPPHLTIVMNDYQALVTPAVGAALTRKRKFGDVFWSEAETHKVENAGSTNSRLLIVEIKPPAKSAG